MVLARTSSGLHGTSGVGSGEEAARLLSEFGWTAGTWKNRTSQLRKWLAFCDEEGRQSLPAEEGDVVAYVGYLSLEGRVSSRSARQYITTISRYHEDAGFPSPTKSFLVSRLLSAFDRKTDREMELQSTRAGLPASAVRRVLELGLTTSAVDTVGRCAMVVFSYLFACRSVTASHMGPDDLEISAARGITARLVYRKAKATARPLVLSIPVSDKWEGGRGPHDLFFRWRACRPVSRGLFDLRAGQVLGSAKLGVALSTVLGELGIRAEEGFHYASHSLRIGAFNELLNLQFSRAWILQRLDWGSEAMFQVYFDSRMATTADSGWFFAHLRQAG